MTDGSEKLVKQALQARRENRPEDAKRDLVEAVALRRRNGSQLGLAKALASLGQIERDLDCRGAALQYYEEAAGIYRSLHSTYGSALQLAHTIRHVADIHRHDSRYELAEAYYSEALGLYRKDPQTPQLDLANALRGFALLKEETGRTAEARLLWREARDLYVAVNVEAGVAESNKRLEKLRA